MHFRSISKQNCMLLVIYSFNFVDIYIANIENVSLESCPINCFCAGKLVNCSNSGLQYVANLPFKTARIHLDYNFMNYFTLPMTEGLRHIEFLSARYNNISTISFECLKVMTHLRILRLDHNRIQKFPENLFRFNSQLQELSLSGNYLTFENLNSSLYYLPMLSRLYLEDNELKSDENIPTAFSLLYNLKHLDISSNWGITNISENFFSSLSELDVEYIGLRKLNLSFIHHNSFNILPTLRHIDISHSRIEKENLKNMFNGLINSTIKVLYMSHIFTHSGKSYTIHNDLFQSLRDTELRIIDLNSNPWGFKGELHNHLFRHLSHLYQLHLANCQLHTIHKDAFRGLNKLKVIILKDNLISCKPECSFLKKGVKLKNLIFIDLSFNFIHGCKGCVVFNEEKFPRLQTILLKNNKLSIISRGMFDNLKSLKRLDLSENQIKVVEPGSFSTIPALEFLYMSGNLDLKSLENDTFAGLNSLTNLYLSDNGIKFIANQTFQHLTHLKFLDLSDNLIQDAYLKLPRQSKHLLELNLGHNLLSTLPSDIQLQFPMLKRIDIPYNRITHIPNMLISNTIETFDLSHNDITYFGGSSFVNVTSLQYLNITGNPIICTCEIKDFLDWLRNSNIYVGNALDMVCAGPINVRNKPILSYHLSLFECTKQYSMFIILGFFVILNLFLFLSFLTCNAGSQKTIDKKTEDTKSRRIRSNRCLWFRDLFPTNSDSSSTIDEINQEEPLICESSVSE